MTMTASEINNESADVCEDCGAAVSEGRAGCQRLFDEVIARDFSDYRYGRTHRLTVDAYSLQHPEQYMRSGKSFAAHLTGICAALEYEESEEINRAVQKWLSGNPQIDKPARLPERRGDLTILHIHNIADAQVHQKRVHEWARAIWDAWSEHHDLARMLIGEALADNR